MRLKTAYYRGLWKKDWHVWFAWRPVVAMADKDERKRVWVWLEYVKRKRDFSMDGYFHKYAVIELKVEEEKL